VLLTIFVAKTKSSKNFAFLRQSKRRDRPLHPMWKAELEKGENHKILYGRISIKGIVQARMASLPISCACKRILFYRTCQKHYRNSDLQCGLNLKMNQLMRNLYSLIFW
jgi:hypothetical protein